MKHNVVAATFVLNALALASGAAHAQAGFTSAPVPQAVQKSFAGATFGSPLGFGADWGTVGVGLFGQVIPKPLRNPNDDTKLDGSGALVFGLGDANKYFGLETQVVTSSLTGNALNGDDSFGEGGGLGFKLHTNLPGGAAVAVGVSGTSRWGNAKNTNVSSVYAVGTKVFSLDLGGSKHALVVNGGVGDGGFLHDFTDDGVNAFGSLAFYVTRQYSAIVDYGGRFTNVGVSASPFNSFPIVITLGMVNVTERQNLSSQFAGSVGYAFSFN